MTPKVMIFAGAPANDAIDWTSEELLNEFLEPLACFAGISKATGTEANQGAEETVLDIATWRSIPLQQQRLETGFTQMHEFDGYYQASQDFFRTADTQGTDAASQSLRDEFYEHSLRVYDDITSSQLPTATLNSTAEETSFISTQDESFRSSIEESTFIDQGDRTLGLGTARLSNLGNLPNASYLNSIEPQTMTVNLIAGVISVAEPRTVRTKWGRSKSLVELIVGDESKSGFSITFWLSDDATSASEATLRSTRRQDIILLRNVALSHFKNKVHGHSLRRNLTKVDLLYRRKLDEDDVGGFYSAKELAHRTDGRQQLLKTQKVREWVLQFVGGGSPRLGKRKEKGQAVRSWELPPPDTQ
ncbi:hypothetical protein PFICI_10336 [Pestalotiopsis fici W106-1]|uniref:Uncharacterized protein n=1 Tax=Pestalotiopsis fici (strain W106-1 / CGMCC3.15140) TaxID=1229662 RepID=W3WWW3_PESFW|nr:uncharacterized protein PFICI_10336 [Pestalotiopsis fici W106-1]ETS78274.1 hypothetical protein PFICI_10336 [Pestalotiopsis fici W106-1]